MSFVFGGVKSADARRSGFPAWVVLFLPPLLWAGNFVIGRGVRDDVPPMTLAFVRHLIAFLALLPFCWRAMRSDAADYWRFRWQIFKTAVAGMAGFNLLIYVGLHSTTAANALLLNSTIPVLIVLLGALLGRDAIQARQAVGMLLSCVGVFVIIAHGEMSRILQLRFARGDLLVFMGMVSFALYSLWLRALPPKVNRLGLLCAQLCVASVSLLPFSLWEIANGHHPAWSVTSLAAVMYVAIAASLLATLLYMAGVARVGAARGGLFIHLIPVYGALLSTLFLGEEIHAYHAVGMASILVGLTVSSSCAGTLAEKPVR